MLGPHAPPGVAGPLSESGALPLRPLAGSDRAPGPSSLPLSGVRSGCQRGGPAQSRRQVGAGPSPPREWRGWQCPCCGVLSPPASGPLEAAARSGDRGRGKGAAGGLVRRGSGEVHSVRSQSDACATRGAGPRSEEIQECGKRRCTQSSFDRLSDFRARRTRLSPPRSAHRPRTRDLDQLTARWHGRRGPRL